MPKLFVGCLIILALLMGGAVLAYNLWGFWGLLGAFVAAAGLLVVLKMLAGRLLVSALLTPFKMKGSVLKDATVTVHEITAAQAPTREFDTDEEDLDEDLLDDPEEAEEYRQEMEAERQEMITADARRRWFHVDLTITPKADPEVGFTHWEPSELLISDPDRTPAGLMKDDEWDADDFGEVADVWIWDPKRELFREDEEGKYLGAQRLRMHIGIEPDRDRVALQYYLEQLGEIILPR